MSTPYLRPRTRRYNTPKPAIKLERDGHKRAAMDVALVVEEGMEGDGLSSILRVLILVTVGVALEDDT